MRIIYATLPAVVMLLVFTLFSNWIPQTRWEPPKKVEIKAGLSPRELATLGEGLVRERGCLVCHTIESGVGLQGRGRGPNFFGIGARPGVDAAYLIESMYKPEAKVVEGYPNIMPRLALTREETAAIINYLQSLGGRPGVQVKDVPPPP